MPVGRDAGSGLDANSESILSCSKSATAVPPALKIRLISAGLESISKKILHAHCRMGKDVRPCWPHKEIHISHFVDRLFQGTVLWRRRMLMVYHCAARVSLISGSNNQKS
ncbi:hypothetical protein GOODEAATRI_006478 [Goodea atripinnis]|uniref:Uncharacterized protein n=1 Tax=Goodea atripinnis TaxID=208336 RepID=A0ABV0N2B7_9TELE